MESEGVSVFPFVCLCFSFMSHWRLNKFIMEATACIDLRCGPCLKCHVSSLLSLFCSLWRGTCRSSILRENVCGKFELGHLCCPEEGKAPAHTRVSPAFSTARRGVLFHSLCLPDFAEEAGVLRNSSVESLTWIGVEETVAPKTFLLSELKPTYILYFVDQTSRMFLLERTREQVI